MPRSQCLHLTQVPLEEIRSKPRWLKRVLRRTDVVIVAENMETHAVWFDSAGGVVPARVRTATFYPGTGTMRRGVVEYRLMEREPDR